MPNHKRIYTIIRRLLPFIGIIVLIAVLTQLDLPAVTTIFAALNPWYCILAFLASIPILLLLNIEWQILLRQQGIHVSFAYSLKNTLIGFFYGFTTPGGIGAYLQAYYLKHESKEPLPKCASNLLTLRTIDLITLLILAVIGGAVLINFIPVLFVILLLLLIFIIALFIFLLGKRSFPFFQRLLNTRILRFIQQQFEDPLDSFFDQLPSYHAIILPFVFSIIGWIVSYTEQYFIAQLFGITIPYTTFILMLAIANVIALLPISIYGLGTREVTLISLFSLYSIPSEQTVSFSLFWYLIMWLTPSIAGAFATLHEHRKLGSPPPTPMDADTTKTE